MKKMHVIFLLCIFLLLSACTQKPQEMQTSTPKTDIEKQPDYGSVFARTDCGDFYSRTDGGKTHITCLNGIAATEVAAPDGHWRFSLNKQTASYDYMLFDGYEETAHGYRGSLFMYIKATKNFVPVFETPTSNAVILPTEDENYADLAWVLAKQQDGAALVPVNLRDSSTETGQIVSLANTDYSSDGENVLTVLSISDSAPKQIRIENKTYEGSSVLSTVAYVYDFEEKKLTKITEEE